MSRVTGFILCWVVVVWGCKGENTSSYSFLSRQPQNVEARRFEPVPSPRDSVETGAINLFGPDFLYIRAGTLYVDDYEGITSKVLALDGAALSPLRIIGREPGQGPGQVQRPFVLLSDSTIVFADENQRKIAQYDVSGRFVDEFRIPGVYPSDVTVLKDRLLVFTTSPRPYLFNWVNGKGDVVDGFQVADATNTNTLKYTGSITSDAEHVYFVGYGEPLIKKYTADGEQVFSVTTVDNLPSEVNYMSFGSGEQHISRFTEHALHSSIGVEVFGPYLIVLPYNDIDGNVHRAIDVYSSEDGRYLKSYRMPHL